MRAIVQAKEVSRWYGIVMGLNNISFEIGPGLTGLVGPNGAGKSTLIQIITGQMMASAGELTVFGDEPFNNPKVLRRIGYCPEKESLHQDLQPLSWLRGLALLSGLSTREAHERSEALLDQVRLPRAHWKKRLGQYSKGMKQRVKLAQALLHNPDLLVLDEPMNGLDPMGRQEIANILKHLAAEGTHVIVSSHILPELESICSDILILNWGRVIASGTRDSIRSDLKDWPEQLLIRCDQPEVVARKLFEEGLLTGFHLSKEESALRIEVSDATAFYKRWPDLLLETGVVTYEIRSESRALKEIFEQVTT